MWKLGDSCRPATKCKVAPGHGAADFNHATVCVQEVEIEPEVHAKGMDTGAAGDEQARTGLVEV